MAVCEPPIREYRHVDVRPLLLGYLIWRGEVDKRNLAEQMGAVAYRLESAGMCVDAFPSEDVIDVLLEHWHRRSWISLEGPFVKIAHRTALSGRRESIYRLFVRDWAQEIIAAYEEVGNGRQDH